MRNGTGTEREFFKNMVGTVTKVTRSTVRVERYPWGHISANLRQFDKFLERKAKNLLLSVED